MQTISDRLRSRANMCTRVNAAVTLLCENAFIAANELERVTRQRDELLASLKRIKANLMHQRLCGQSAGLLHAAIQAEGDAEEIIAKAEE